MAPKANVAEGEVVVKKKKTLMEAFANDVKTDLGLALEVKPDVRPEPFRERLPNDRDAKTFKFSSAGHDGCLTVGILP